MALWRNGGADWMLSTLSKPRGRSAAAVQTGFSSEAIEAARARKLSIRWRSTTPKQLVIGA